MATPTDAGPGIAPTAISVTTYSPHGRWLLIKATGNITFKTMSGGTVDWPSIPVGLYQITVSEITAATATGYVLT